MPSSAIVVIMVGLLMLDARSTISGSNVCVNTFHIGLGGAVTNAEATALLAPIKAFYDATSLYRFSGTNVVIGSRVLWSDTSQWQKPVGKPGTPTYVPGKWLTPPLIIGVPAVTSTAGSGTPSLPGQLASVVSWRSSTAGRTGRGRTYLGNLSGAAMAGSLVAPAFITAVNTAAGVFLSNLSTVPVASGQPYLGVWSPTTGIIRPILTGATDATFDTMRSRVK